MIPVVVTLLIVGAVLWVWHDARPLLQRRVVIAEVRASTEGERVAIDRERVAVERLAALKPAVTDEDPMPQEFVDWAMQESSDWAREDKLARMRELYARLKDWNKVRVALMAEDNAPIKSTF
jgi:hypothetical protein